MNRHTRREMLKFGGSSLAIGAVSGCLNRTNTTTEETTVQTSFFTLFDFTRNVAGDKLDVSNPVPAEQHGHGWEPSTDLLPEIVESDAFVYLDASGFQPWAESAAAEIEESYDDVLLIDVLDGIELLEYETDYHEEHNHDPEKHEYDSVAEVELIDPQSRQVLAQFHFGHWHGSLPTLAPDEQQTVEPRFVDNENTPVPIETEDYRIRVDIQAEREELVSVTVENDQFTIEGQATGEATVTIELWKDEEQLFSTEALSMTVDEQAEEGPEPDHGLVDVKFFSDPVLVQQGVQNIRDGLIELDPDNESTYRRNADKYIEQLDELDQLFRAELSDRDRELAVLAGHDSFNYLARRYGFAIETPVGLSPNDEPSSGDIAAAVDVVEEHEISHVLWDYFDGDRTAEAIVSEADAATETAMVSAAESYLQDWKAEGYGDYIGQMREINLPAFKAALGAD